MRVHFFQSSRGYFNVASAALFALISASLIQAAVIPPNSVTIKEQSGSPQSGRPFTISRFFAKGEVPHFAQAVISGSPVLTQCDVKTRWDDGSVQHAMISFTANLGAGASLTVNFVDQPSGNNMGFLTAADMLDRSRFNFGAQMEVTSGSTKVANARTMLAAGRFRYWLQGSVCTQVIIEDSTPALAYDIGWDGYKPLHPIFVATFYPGWEGVKVEMIMENMWTTRLEDQSYALALKTQEPLSATPVYSKPSFKHISRTRWRQVFWSGTAPGAVNVDYNFPYIIYSKAVANYDLTRTLSTSAINSEVSEFNSGDRGDLTGTAQWNKYFPATGGWPDRAPIARWYLRYLWSFHPNLYPVMLGNAEAGAHVPIHFRESASGRYFDDQRTTDAFALPLSIDARPNVRTDDPTGSNHGGNAGADAFNVVGAFTDGPWSVDEAHQPDFAYIPYLITGDWYFLEEMYFWASYDLATGNPDMNCNYCRVGSLGIFHEGSTEIRGIAWTFRNLADALLMAPDGSPEKKYFTQKMNNNIAVREGMYGITDGAFYDPGPNSLWTMGQNQFAAHLGPNPLHFLEQEGVGTEGLNADVVQSGTSPWMVNYCHLIFGHLKELGLPIAKLQETAARNLLNQIRNPDYNPYLTSYYRMPLFRRSDGKFFTTWASVKGGFPLSDQTTTTWSGTPSDPNLSYPLLALAASSYLPGITDGALNGQDAWNWMKANVPNQNLLNDNLLWAISPRAAASSTTTPGTCDLNGDGTEDPTDVQIAVNQALGSAPCGTADLDGNGSCNVVDVQRVINVLLGGACRVGQ